MIVSVLAIDPFLALESNDSTLEEETHFVNSNAPEQYD